MSKTTAEGGSQTKKKRRRTKATTTTTTTTERKPFRPNYDYEVDYNDHFETPLNAYTDILPLLDSLVPTNGSNGNGNGNGNNSNNDHSLRRHHVLYDPYYCDGRTKRLLEGLGFDNVVHEKRDFYKDVGEGKVPEHHTLVTNPPYSDDHKERCLEFCTRQFRSHGRAFFLLVPSYVAARNYYRRILGDTIRDVAYLVPSEEYSYSHPEGTGHEVSPFASLWFCCIGRDKIREWTVAAAANSSADGETTNRPYRIGRTNTKTDRPTDARPRLVTSFDELVSLGVVSLENRPNPRQRKKMRKQLAAQAQVQVQAQAQAQAQAPAPAQQHMHTQNHSTKKSKTKTKATTTAHSKEPVKGKKRGTAKSKYRTNDGTRTKKRF